MHIKPILLYIFIAATTMLHGQEQWTLDRCINHAMANNIQLKQQELRIQVSQNRFAASQWSLLPTIRGLAGQTFRFGRSVDPLTYEFSTENTLGSSFTLSSDLDVFKGWQKQNLVKKHKLELNQSMSDLEWAKNDLSLSITRYFLVVMFNRELVTMAQNRLEITAQQVAQTKTLVDAGSLPRGDYLEIQAQLASDELSLVTAENEHQLSLLDLAQLLDLEDPDDFIIKPPSLTHFDGFVTDDNHISIYNTALALLPRIQSAEIALQLAQKDLAISKGKLLPSLGMHSYLGTGYSDQIHDLQTGNIMPFTNQLSYAGTSSLQFILRIPVFDGLASQTEIKNAELGVLHANYELERIKSTLRKEIHQAHADARAAWKKYQATLKTVNALQEAFRNTTEKFNLGILTSLDYNLAKNNLDQAQSDLLQAKYQYLFNQKILDFYRGLPLKMR